MRPSRLIVLLPVGCLACTAPEPPPATPEASTQPPPVAAPPTSTSATIAQPRRFAVETDPAPPLPRARRCRSPATYGNSARGISDVMTVSNEGGWCRRSSVLYYDDTQTQSGPYIDMSVIEQPQHGKVEIHKLNTQTAYYYQPEAGYVGSDRFVLQGLPTYGRITVSVTVRPTTVRPARVTTPAGSRPSTP